VEDYPRDLLELEARFSTEAECREYLAQWRWPEGFRCPQCTGSKAWPVGGVPLEFAACGAQASVTAETIFQDTRTPLPVWFRAMWVGNNAEERRQRARIAAGSGSEEL